MFLDINPTQNRPAGYLFLIERYQLNVIPNWHQSSINSIEYGSTVIQDQQVVDTYPASWWPGETLGAHLQFALQMDGINLGILAALFAVLPETELLPYLLEDPTETYRRQIWFLYEFLTGKQLKIQDLADGEYIDLLDRRFYYCTQGIKIERQRIVHNLLGTPAFCPIIRHTDKLTEIGKKNLKARCEEVVKAYPNSLLRRALTYLHKKETRSSFEIEHITPDNSRTGKFVRLLSRAGQTDFCEKQHLIELQNQVVDARFRDSDYRTDQNYVGQSISHRKEIIHYICPKPTDLPALMDGLLAAHKIMHEGHVHPIIHAAAIAYGFVFMHPFNDGNGRIHRFLINNILSQEKFIPAGLSFPISAAMLKDPQFYDRSLESFSRPLVALTQYTLDNMGRMTVHNQTAQWYRYIDMTAQAEALAEFIYRTIEDELIEELDFLNRYDETKQKLQAIVDMPDHLTDLFIRLCNQNGGHLSAKKRETHFSFLSDEELAKMEAVILSCNQEE